MKKATKDYLKAIISNQELIMKSLNIKVPKPEALARQIVPKNKNAVKAPVKRRPPSGK